MSQLSRETRDLLARGREGEPMAPARRDRVKSAILAQAAAASVATTTTSAAAWMSMTAKAIGVVSAITIAGVGIGVLSARSDRARDAHGTSTVSSAASPAPARPAHAIDPQLTPIPAIAEPAIAEPATSALTPVVAPVNAPSSTSPVQAHSPHRGTPIPRVSPPEADRVAPAPPIPSAPSTASAASSSSLAEETRLLRDAHSAIAAGNAAGALALLDEHASRFPASALEPERSAERVFALCRAGRTADAEAAATTFLAAHPAGPLSTRVRTACAGGNR